MINLAGQYQKAKWIGVLEPKQETDHLGFLIVAEYVIWPHTNFKSRRDIKNFKVKVGGVRLASETDKEYDSKNKLY